MSYSYDRRVAFKVPPRLIALGRDAYEAAKEAEKKVSDVKSDMEAVLAGLRLEAHKAKRDGGDIRNTLGVLNDVEGYVEEITQGYEAFRRLDLKTIVGAALSDLALELPDTPNLRVVK